MQLSTRPHTPGKQLPHTLLSLVRPCFLQRWRLAEIRLEDYAFVILSRIAGMIEAEVGARGAPVMVLLPASEPCCWCVLAS